MSLEAREEGIVLSEGVSIRTYYQHFIASILGVTESSSIPIIRLSGVETICNALQVFLLLPVYVFVCQST